MNDPREEVTGRVVSWQYGQILYRLNWMPHQHEPTIRVTEYRVVEPTPKGGWIVEHDAYVGDKPDRSKGNIRPMLKEGRTWRSASSNFAHATLESARHSLAMRTRRHMKLLWGDVYKVQRRCHELGIDAEAQKPRLLLRQFAM